MTSKMPLPGELDPIETASRDEISALQLERLKWSVRHTYDNVEPYRQKCQAKGVHPDDLKCLADLGKFPFMTKTDLRDHYPFGLFAVPRTKLARLHASSGTTGKSVVVGYTSLAQLAGLDPLAVTKQISQMMRSTCWHNSPQARGAIGAVVALADQASGGAG